MRLSAIMDYDSPKGGFSAGGINETGLFEKFNGEKIVYDTVINVDQYDKK